MLSLLLSPFFLLAAVCGILIFFCFRTQKKSYRVVLLLAAVACILGMYASTTPVPGSEGPGLVALMACGVAAGAALILLILRLLPRPIPIPRSPELRMSGWLLGTFGVSTVAAFAVAVFTASSYEAATLCRSGDPPAIRLFRLADAQSQPPEKDLLCRGRFAAVEHSPRHPHLLVLCLRQCVCHLFLPAHLPPPHHCRSSLFPLYQSPKSAFVLNVALPLCVCSTQFLLAAIFGIGMLVKHQETKKI